MNMKNESMSLPFETQNRNLAEAGETLRLVAGLAEPEGLRERIHSRLDKSDYAPVRRGFWSLWMPVRRLQYGAVAVLAFAVAVSTWAVYRDRQPVANAPQAVRPAESGAGPESGPERLGSGFNTSGAERRPAGLNPIKAPPVQKKKPSAGKAKPKALSPAVAAPAAQQ